MNTITVAGLMEALGLSQPTVSRLTSRPDFPAPAASESKGGRPEKRWRIADLPDAVTIKGKAFAVRVRAEKWVHDRVFVAGATAALQAPPVPALSSAGTLPATERPERPAGLSIPMCVVPAAQQQSVSRRGQTRKGKTDDKLTDKERLYRDSAIILCRAIEDATSAANCSEKEAISGLARRLVAGEAFPVLIDAANATYIKQRASRGPLGGESAQVARLARMMGFYRAGCLAGDPGLYLVPGAPEPIGYSPIHIRAFLLHFCKPSRPPVLEAWRDSEGWFAAQGIPRPAADTFYRISKSLPVTIKYRGRITGSEWRSLKPYIDRDVSMFKSNDIWVGDGHSFKAKVQHPIHGQPYIPEVTIIIDWVSRKIVGWSVDLAESTVAVSAAFRHAQQKTRARPLAYYSDNGSGQTGKSIDCPIHGTLARQGIAHETGIPGNPQGRGIIERLWQVTTIPLARTYPTCIWKGADKEATRKMLVALNKKDGSGERLLPTFAQFLDDITAMVDHYNLKHEHRELDGNVPEAEYQAKLDPDSVVFGPSNLEIAMQWMPEVGRTPQRGVISLFGNEYARKELVDELAEGEKVRVRYDIHDASRVFLLRMNGQPIGEAVWDAHKRAAFPVARIEQLREQRAAGKIKRGESIISEAQAELGHVHDALAIVVPEIPAEKTIVDFLPTEKVAAARELGPEDFLPKTEEKAEESSYMDTVLMLWGAKEDPEENESTKGTAAG